MPLRPRCKPCRNLEIAGICTYGLKCFYDHPVDLVEAAAAASMSKKLHLEAEGIKFVSHIQQLSNKPETRFFVKSNVAI